MQKEVYAPTGFESCIRKQSTSKLAYTKEEKDNQCIPDAENILIKHELPMVNLLC